METHSEEEREIKTGILRDKGRNPDPDREKARDTETEAEGKGHSRRETQTYKNHKKPRGRTRNLGDIRKSETSRLPPAHRWILASIQSLCNETETHQTEILAELRWAHRSRRGTLEGVGKGTRGRLGRGQDTAQRMPPPLHSASGVGVRTCVCWRRRA